MVKKAQAEVVLEFRALGTAKATKLGITDDLYERRQAMKERLNKLNERGPQAVTN